MPEDFKSTEMRRFAGALAEIRFHLERMENTLDEAMDKDNWEELKPADISPKMGYDLEMVKRALAIMKDPT